MTSYKLLHEGTASLIRTNKPSIQVHLVLVEGVLFLFQREGEKYILKFFQSGTNANTTNEPLSPIIRLSHLIVRPNAAGKFNSKKNSFLMSKTVIFI